MSMPSGGRRRGSSLTRGLDPDAVRAANAAAPTVPHLRDRIIKLFAPYRGWLLWIVLLVLASSGLNVVPPLLTQAAFDRGLFVKGGPDLRTLTVIVLAMIGVYILTNILTVAQTYFTSRTGNGVMGDLRIRMFQHLQSMDVGFFTRTKTGEIQSRLQNDVGGVANVLTSTVSSILGNIVTVIAALVAMVLLNWQLTIIALICMPPLVYVQRKVGTVRARIATETQESLARMTTITEETLSISGIILAKSFNRQPYEIKRFAAETAEQVRLQFRQAMSGQWFFALVSLLMSSIPAVVYWVAGALAHAGTTVLTAGTIVAFTTVQARLLFPLVNLMRVSLDVQTSKALFARIFEYLDLKPQVTEAPDAVNLDPQDTSTGHVEFLDVAFRYPGAATDETTLRHLSFTVETGTFAAFVGPSGAGKSTIVNLIPRYWDVTDGQVFVSGRDVRTVTQQSLLDEVGIVTQDTYLFHATIAENLRYAKPDASDAELVAAVTAANLMTAIEKFPDGLNTIVGERGYRLSGGEQQRLAIARVLLKNPPILVLDEATSALDTVSEHIVQQAIDDAARGRTTIAIAHRLSTIYHADTIYVVVDGEIVEHGTHQELLAQHGEYFRLYDQQRDDGESPDPRAG